MKTGWNALLDSPKALLCRYWNSQGAMALTTWCFAGVAVVGVVPMFLLSAVIGLPLACCGSVGMVVSTRRAEKLEEHRTSSLTRTLPHLAEPLKAPARPIAKKVDIELPAPGAAAPERGGVVR